MPSAKARGAKPKSSLKRDDARGKRKGKEVRELWFNPHVKKRGETLEEIYGCDCDCDVMLDENVQHELRRLSKVYSQTTVGDEDDDDEVGKSKGFLCFKKSSQRSRSKQNEDKEQTKRRRSKEKEDREKTKRRKSKEKEDTEKSKRRKSKEKADTEMRKRRKSNEREQERKSPSRPPSSVNGRFKTQEEVRHYRELKRIYTTKPRPRQVRAKPTDTTCFKTKKDKRREEDAENSLESSSVDSVYSATHMSRKPEAERASKSQARTSKRDASSRQRRSSQREDDKKQKETKKHKKSDVGCCGKRKKSKVDKEEEEFEAYKLAQSAPQKSKKPTASPECALTPEEIELLEKLKQTYAMDQPKVVVRKAPPPPPPPEEPGCCGSKSKKKKRRSEDESYTPRKTKSAEINVKRKHLPKTGKSKSDSSLYSSNRKETRNKTMKHKNCFCFGCIRRKCQSGKPTKKHAKKPKEKTKIPNVKRPKTPVIKPHHELEQPKKSVNRKPKPTKTKSQEKFQQSPDVKRDGEQVGKKLSFLSCCSLSKKEKQKKDAIPKVKSSERVRKQTSFPYCCSFTKREKSEKPDEAQQKSPKPKEHEMLPKKASNVSCCSFSKSDKTKKQAVTQQKPTKVREQEKPQKKASNVSCCSFAKKEKSKKKDETAQKPQKAKERVQKEPKTVTCCPLTTKDKPKESDGIARRNIFNILCRLTDKKDKTKNEHDAKNVKSQEKPSNMTCCSFSKKVKPKELPESPAKPPKTKQKIKVKEKLNAISCCPVFKKNKQNKSVDSPQKAPKNKLSEITCCSIYRKHKQSKTEDAQQKSPRTKVKVKMKNKASETSCCSGLFQKDKSKKSDGTEQKAPKKKSSTTTCCSELFQMDKQKKSDGFPRQPPRTKDQTKIKKKLSEASCCPIFHKDKSKRVDVPKRKPTKVKSTEKLQKKSSCISVFSCCAVDKNKPKTLDRTKKKPVKPKSRDRTQNPFEIFCAFCKKRRSGKPKLMRPLTQIKATGPPRLEQIKPQSSKPRTKTISKMSFQTCWDWCDDDADDNVPIKEETIPRTSAEKLKQTAPKSKSSCTSFWTCCSSTCVPSKTKEKGQRKSKRTDKVEKRKRAVDERAVKTKPENISYCKALYQEFENLAMQQTLCPILLSETNLSKKSKGTINKYGLSYCQQNLSKLSIAETRPSLSTKSKKQQAYQKETKEIRKSKAKEDKEIQRKLQKVPSATYIKLPKRKVKTEMQNVNSNSDSGIEKVYVPQYVLGKPVQLGVSLAHARNMTYNLILNRDTRKRSDKYFHKGFTYGIGCQN